MPHKDPERRKQYKKEWDARNADKLAAYHAVRNARKKAKLRAARRCKWCDNPHENRRHKCPHCGRTARVYTRSPRKYKPKWESYGLTKDEYNALLEACGGSCEICQKAPERLVIDHDHDTGAVRGLLCDRCNHMLGHALDNEQTLLLGARYIREKTSEGHAGLCGVSDVSKRESAVR